MKKKSYHRLKLVDSRRECSAIQPGSFVEMPTVLRFAETAQVLARTSIVGSRLRILKEETESIQVEGLVELVEKRIAGVLVKRERWEIAPARVPLAVKEVKVLFAGVRDVPKKTFRLVKQS